MTPYDAWRLQGPPECEKVGTCPGEECGRYPEPDEDQPCGYRPRPCNGTMVSDDVDVWCDTCGEPA